MLKIMTMSEEREREREGEGEMGEGWRDDGAGKRGDIPPYHLKETFHPTHQGLVLG